MHTTITQHIARRLSRTSIVALLTCAGLAGASLHAAEPDDAPLRGPSVTDKVAPGGHTTFAPEAGGDRKRGEREIPHPLFMRALNEAIGDSAPEAVRASKELQSKLKAISDDFNQAQRTYAQQNREALAKMRGEGRGAKKDAKNPKDKPEADSMQEMTDEDRQAMMERMREIREKAPKAADAHTKIWALLSEPQQKAVEERLEVFREEARKRENEQYVDRFVKRKAPEGEKPSDAKKSDDKASPKDKAPQGADAGPALAPISAEHRERLIKLFERLPPEQREEILRRFEERLRSGEGFAPPAAAPNATRPGARQRPNRPADKQPDQAPQNAPQKTPKGAA